MKVKENPSLILAFHGMLGRKKQTSLLLILLTMVFSFLTAATIYSGSSAQALQDTRCELYGEWQYLRLSDTDTDAAQVRDNLPASAKASTAIQDGIVLGADNGLAGGIGTVDSAFAQLGRIVPISGNFPAQPDEIAMTTTLLDALGCSYDLGQTITLKVADNDYDPLSGSGKIVEQTYTLCGVLPAYDVYWNLGSNLTVSAVVAEPLALAGQKFQTFYDLNADTVGTASDDPDLIANEYAYPQEDTVSSSLTFLLMIAILVSFFAVAQYFADEEKPTAGTAMQGLQAQGVRTVMLTGDAPAVAELVAKDLGIDEVHAGLLPADKVAWVEKLLAQKPEKKELAFVGDGINDAPVLMRADIGIAMGALGSDAAIEAADIVLMDDDPAKISLAMRISRKCMRIVYQNIVFALAVKALCLILSALGITNMWWGVFADVGVMILAVLNATRMLNVKQYQ